MQTSEELFRQSCVSDQIAIKACDEIEKEGVEPILGIFSLLQHGLVGQSKRLSRKDDVAVLAYLENYLNLSKTYYKVDSFQDLSHPSFSTGNPQSKR